MRSTYGDVPYRRRVQLTWSRALSWRLGQHLLDPVGDLATEEVVGRVVAVPAQHDHVAELVVRTRQNRSESGGVAEALASGRLVCVFAWRGATHLVRTADASTYLALRAASRMWELPSWQEHYGLAPDDWPALLDAVRAALADGPVTLDELGAAVTANPRFRHLSATFDDGAGTLLKPLSWQGVLGLGPSRDGRTTFRLLESSPGWVPAPDLGAAGPAAVEAYARAFGPVTPAHLRYWLAEGLGAGRHLRGWVRDLGDRLVEVDVEGERAWLPADLVDEVATAAEVDGVRLLPASDPWLLGPGTADAHVVPPARRRLFSQGAAPLLHGGVVAGTWAARGGRLEVAWFPESGPVPAGLQGEAARVTGLLGRDLALDVRRADAASEGASG